MNWTSWDIKSIKATDQWQHQYPAYQGSQNRWWNTVRFQESARKGFIDIKLALCSNMYILQLIGNKLKPWKFHLNPSDHLVDGICLSSWPHLSLHWQWRRKSFKTSSSNIYFEEEKYHKAGSSVNDSRAAAITSHSCFANLREKCSDFLKSLPWFKSQFQINWLHLHSIHGDLPVALPLWKSIWNQICHNVRMKGIILTWTGTYVISPS